MLFQVTDEQRERFRALLKTQQHHQITPEVRRELFQQSQGQSVGAAKQKARDSQVTEMDMETN